MDGLWRAQGRLSEDHAAHIMLQVVSAVRYCHERNITVREGILQLCYVAKKGLSEACLVELIMICRNVSCNFTVYSVHLDMVASLVNDYCRVALAVVE